MILCLDVGNSHVYGGVFKQDEIVLRFRHTSGTATSDELGIFLKSVLRENHLSPDEIKRIGICSVVPQLDYSLRSACIKYFSIEPFFLQSGVKTGLNIKYRNPSDVGADRIANAIAAISLFPSHPLIIIDFGTATTFCIVDAHRTYFGGAILPGVRLSMEVLSHRTAKLPPVDLVRVDEVIGRSTIESIQSGLYFGALGAAKEIVERVKKTMFRQEKVLVLATGGFAPFFEHEKLYDHLLPDLVLQGIKIAMTLNQSA